MQLVTVDCKRLLQWNSRGYDIAKLFAHKFTFISPVWLQIQRRSEVGYSVLGAHGIDKGQHWDHFCISADLLDCLMIVTGLVFYCCTWSFSSLFTWLSNIRARWRPSVPKVCQMLGLDEFTETFVDPSCKIRGVRSMQFDAVFDPLTFWIAAVCLKSEAKV